MVSPKRERFPDRDARTSETSGGDLAALARSHAPMAIRVLREIADNPKADAASRQAAADALRKRGLL